VVKLNLERVRELILSCKGSLNIYDLEFLRSFCEYFVRDNALSSFLNNILFGDLNRYGSSSIYDRKKGVIVIDEKANYELSKNIIENMKIVLPSLESQAKIVSILDKFDKLVNDISEGLPAEIEARRKQYEYYRNKLLSFEELTNE